MFEGKRIRCHLLMGRVTKKLQLCVKSITHFFFGETCYLFRVQQACGAGPKAIKSELRGPVREFRDDCGHGQRNGKKEPIGTSPE